MSLQAVHVFEEHRDHVYSLTAIGDLCVSGGGDGLVLVHSLASGELLYGLGANQAAVRACMHANRLVCVGDDGTVISLRVPGAGGGGGAIERRPRRLLLVVLVLLADSVRPHSAGPVPAARRR